MKKCSKCGIEKDESEFHKDKSRKNGLQPQCKKCRSTAKHKQASLCGMKRCSKCWIEKCESNFSKNKNSKDGLHAWCKECVKQYNQDNKDWNKKYAIDNAEKITKRRKQYEQDNAEQITERKKLYYQNNKQTIRDRQKRYYHTNTEKIAERNKLYTQHKRQIDEQFRIACLLRNRLNKVIRNNQKFGSAVRDLWCSVEFLLDRMKTMLGREPTADDQIDHIMPAKFLDLTNYSHQRLFCHYLNLRYLPSKENMSRDYTDIVSNKELMSLVWEIS
jgi:hypothetical protein